MKANTELIKAFVLFIKWFAIGLVTSSILRAVAEVILAIRWW